MMRKKHCIALVNLLLMALFTFGQQNLISNGDFEDANGKRCDGWFNICGSLFEQCDTGYYCSTGIIYADSPPEGGNWSLFVSGGEPVVAWYSKTYLTGINDSASFLFSFWAKINELGDGWITIKNKSFQSITLSRIDLDSSEWKYYEITIDSLELESDDTLILQVNAQDVGAFNTHVYVDLFSFIKIENPVSKLFMNKKIRYNPVLSNPVMENLTIIFRNERFYNIEIIITNPVGKIILTKQVSPNQNEKNFIDIKNFKKGIYFLNIKNKEFVTNQKFIKL